MKKNTKKAFKKISEQAVLTTTQSRKVAGGAAHVATLVPGSCGPDSCDTKWDD